MGLFSRRRENSATRAIESVTGMEQLTDLQAPPFGLGFQRSATDFQTGTTPGGRRYRKFHYSYSGGVARFEGSVLVVDLPFELPTVFWTTASKTRIGIDAGGPMGCLQYQNLRVCSADEKVAKQVFEAIVLPTQDLALSVSGPVDLSVDRNRLVAIDVPDEEYLPSFLAGLDRLVDSLNAKVPRRLELPPLVEGQTFYGHPEWKHEVEGDRALSKEFGLNPHPSGRVEDLLTCDFDGIRMVAFRYTWLSESAYKAKMTRGMVIDSDRESVPVCAFFFDAELPEFSLNGERVGQPMALGNPRFDDSYTLRCSEPQLVFQLFNERVQSWVLSTRPFGWTARGNMIRFDVPTHDALLVGECEHFLYGWLDRVPAQLREYLHLPDMPALIH